MTTEGPTREVRPARDFFGIADVRDEMDRLWESVMGARGRPFRMLGRLPRVPAVDVFEKEGKVQVRAELPGLTEKDIEIEVTPDGIRISGEKKEEREVKEENYYRAERSYGRFSRLIGLPAGADADKAEAHFKDGVLEINMPLKAGETKKKISVKAG